VVYTRYTCVYDSRLCYNLLVTLEFSSVLCHVILKTDFPWLTVYCACRCGIVWLNRVCCMSSVLDMDCCSHSVSYGSKTSVRWPLEIIPHRLPVRWPLAGISISISFSIAQTPTVRPRVHYIVIISCYSEQYARLKRNVFSPQRKVDVDCVLFSSVSSCLRALGVAVENLWSAVFRFVRGITCEVTPCRYSLRDYLWDDLLQIFPEIICQITPRRYSLRDYLWVSLCRYSLRDICEMSPCRYSLRDYHEMTPCRYSLKRLLVRWPLADIPLEVTSPERIWKLATVLPTLIWLGGNVPGEISPGEGVSARTVSQCTWALSPLHANKLTHTVVSIPLSLYNSVLYYYCLFIYFWQVKYLCCSLFWITVIK